MGAPAQAMLLMVVSTLHGTLASYSPLYGYDRGSYAYSPEVPIVRSYGDVFPDSLMPLLIEECRNANRWEKKARDPNLKDSKAATNWAPMENIRNPRSAAEMAVAILYNFAFPDGKVPRGGVAGGEWWVQMRSSNENIGFHVDKDEGIASEEQWMKMPVLSTVTYLTDVGGPTLVLNQSSNRGGNKQEPELPVRGVLVYPKRNRHMLFRGNLQHGVVGEFGQVSQGGAERITFLVNWWDKRPMAPYCMNVKDKIMYEHICASALQKPAELPKTSPLGWFSFLFGGQSDVETQPTKKETIWRDIKLMLEAGDLGPSSSTREMPELIEVPSTPEKRRHVDIRVPPRKRYNFPVPSSAADGVTFSGKIVEYQWSENEVGGILHDLDPSSRMCWHLFNNIPGVKVIIFRDAREKSSAERFDLNFSYPIAHPFIQSERNGGPQVYTADSHSGYSGVSTMFRNTLGGSKRKNLVMVAAMVVGQRGDRKFYRMRHNPKEAPSMQHAISWIEKLWKRDPDTLHFDEIRGGKRRKRKGNRKKRKSLPPHDSL